MVSLVTFITFVSIGLWVFVANSTSPQTKEGSLIIVNLVYFFGTLFVSLAGIITLVLYSAGNWQLKKLRVGSVESIHKPRIILLRSLRHGILIAAALVGIGLLNALNLSNPLNIILLISAAILTEIYLFGH
jgi:hypothetical protein